MTKAELIRKLAKKVGVYDSDAKIFFEIFLQQTSSILNPGEAVSIKNFGFFQLRKGRIKSASPAFDRDDEDAVYPDLIVYTSSEKLTDEKDDMLIFNIPARKEIEYNQVDSYFSLSIGKPVIPLHGVKSTEFFIAPTGNELKRLLESKVDNLLAHSDLVKNYTKGNEFLQITPEIFNTGQYELNWNEFTSKQNRLTQTDILTDPESIPWDFGENISKEIEEESILDLDRNEVPFLEPENANVSWDFGDEYYGEVQEEFSQLENEDEFPGEVLEETEDSVEEEIIHPVVPEEPEIVGNFQRVKSLTREYTSRAGSNITQSSEDVTWDFGPVTDDEAVLSGHESNLYSRYDEPVQDKNGYTEVKNKRKTYDIELPGSDNERLDSLIKEEIEAGEDIEDTDAVSGFYQDEVKQAPPKQPGFESLPEEEDYGKRKSTPIFLISISVIVLVGAGLFIFLTKGNIFKKQEVKSQAESVIKSTPSVIINRSYEIPVTYPYPKNDSVSDPVSSINFPVKDSVKTVQQPIIKKKEDTAPAVSKSTGNRVEETTKQQGTKIRDNLYKDGNNYIVQVSAWKSKDKAEREVARYKGKGLNAFIQQVEIPGRGTWYRVKIGKLKSQAEAEKYL